MREEPSGGPPEGSSFPLIIELGAGKGLVGLGAAAVLAASAAKATEGPPAVPESPVGAPGPPGAPGGPPSAYKCDVLLTDLDYCLKGLRTAVHLNRHFAQLIHLTNNIQGAPMDPLEGPLGGAPEGTARGPLEGPLGGGPEGPTVGAPEGACGVAKGPLMRVAVEALDWFCPEKCAAWGPLGGPPGGPPLRDVLVVAADVLWLRELVEPFVQTLAFILIQRETTLTAADAAASAAAASAAAAAAPAAARTPSKGAPQGPQEGLAEASGGPPEGAPLRGPPSGVQGAPHALKEKQLRLPFAIIAHQTRCTAVDNLFFTLLKKYKLSASLLSYGGPQGAPLEGPLNSIKIYMIQRDDTH